MLYPTELLRLIVKIFNFSPSTDSNELPLRKRTLYLSEVRGQTQFSFSGSPRKAALAAVPAVRLAREGFWRGRPCGYRLIVTQLFISVNGGGGKGQDFGGFFAKMRVRGTKACSIIKSRVYEDGTSLLPNIGGSREHAGSAFTQRRHHRPRRPRQDRPTGLTPCGDPS